MTKYCVEPVSACQHTSMLKVGTDLTNERTRDDNCDQQSGMKILHEVPSGCFVPA